MGDQRLGYRVRRADPRRRPRGAPRWYSTATRLARAPRKIRAARFAMAGH